MHKEIITSRQAVSMMTLFILGSLLVLGINAEAEQDTWLCFLGTVVLAVPFILIYARIMRLFPEKDLYAVLPLLFGKILGKLSILLFAWFSLHLCAMLLEYYSQFVQIASMAETPQLPLMLIMMLTVAYLCKSGIETMGKWSLAVLPFICLLVLFTVILSLKHMNFPNLLPVFSHSPGVIFAGSLQMLILPVSEIALFMGLSGSIKKEDSPYKIYLYSLLLVSIVYLVVIFRNVEVLGVPIQKAKFFPSFVSARVISVGSFLTRMEGVISINFILSGIGKIAVCLLVAAKGVASLFGIREYRKLVLPVGLFALALGNILYKSSMEILTMIPVYLYYFAPFTLILPVIIWITAEVKTRKSRSRQTE